MTFPLEGTATSYVAKTGHSLIRGDLAQGTQFYTWEQFFREGLRSVIAIPLLSNGKVIGTLSLFSRRLNAYGCRDQYILESLASRISPAIENPVVAQELRLLAMAMESISDAVVFADSSGNIQFVNKACEEMFGYRSNEILGCHISALCPNDPVWQKTARRMIGEACEGGWRFEVASARKNGQPFDARLCGLLRQE